jgi:hypothetical protein
VQLFVAQEDPSELLLNLFAVLANPTPMSADMLQVGVRYGVVRHADERGHAAGGTAPPSSDTPTDAHGLPLPRLSTRPLPATR